MRMCLFLETLRDVSSSEFDQSDRTPGRRLTALLLSGVGEPTPARPYEQNVIEPFGEARLLGARHHRLEQDPCGAQRAAGEGDDVEIDEHPASRNTAAWRSGE